MLIVREVFTAKPGQASKLSKLLKKAFSFDPNMPKFRVMTDLVGNYNTVVVEVETESLEKFEKQMKDYKKGKIDPKMAEEMSKYTEMYLYGKREIFQIEE